MPLKVDISPLSALQRAKRALPPDGVSVGWLERALKEQATYLLILVVSLLGALPGASLPAGLAICVLSLRLILAGRFETLPEKIAACSVTTKTASYALGRAISMIALCERVLPLSQARALQPMRPIAGGLLFLLGLALLVPFPFSNVLPALSAAALVLAMIEGSVVLFVLGTASAVVSIAVIGSAVFVATNFVTSI